MRVNISYAVELDELPEKVWDLIEEASGKLTKAASDLALLVDDHNQEDMTSVKEIDTLRQELSTLDAQLADFSSILAGVVRTNAELYLAEQDKERQLNGEVSEDAQKLIDQMEENENDTTTGNLPTG